MADTARADMFKVLRMGVDNTVKSDLGTFTKVRPDGFVWGSDKKSRDINAFLSACTYSASMDAAMRSFRELSDCGSVTLPDQPGGPEVSFGDHYEWIEDVEEDPGTPNQGPKLISVIGTLNATAGQQSVVDLKPSTRFLDPEDDTLTFRVQFYTGSSWTFVLPGWASYVSGVLTVTPPDAMDYVFRLIATDAVSGLSALDDFTIHATQAQQDNQPPRLDVPFAQINATSGKSFTFALNAGGHFSDPDNDPLGIKVEFYTGGAWSQLPNWLSYTSGSLTGTPPDAMDYTIRVMATDPGGLSATGSLTLHVSAPEPQPKILKVTRQLTATDLIWVIDTQLVTGYPYRLEERHNPNDYQTPDDNFGQWLEIGHDANNELRYTYANGKPPAGQAVRFEFRLVNVDTGEVLASPPVLGFDYVTPSGEDGPTTVYP